MNINTDHSNILDIDVKLTENVNIIEDLISSLVPNQINYIYLKKQKYEPAWLLQQKLHDLVKNNKIYDVVLFLEHDHVYTFGKNADKDFLLDTYPKSADIVKTDRGGQVTYHGPGQLIGYPIINLNFYKKSITWFMRTLEQVIIDTLREFNIKGSRKSDYPGVWIDDEKICAMGVRISRWVTMHGFALNINPDMRYFDGMIPCGIFEHGVTSFKDLIGKDIKVKEIINVIMVKMNSSFKRVN